MTTDDRISIDGAASLRALCPGLFEIKAVIERHEGARRVESLAAGEAQGVWLEAHSMG